MRDLIERQAAIDAINDFANKETTSTEKAVGIDYCKEILKALPSEQTEQKDYTEMKREFIRMAEYIDVLLKVSDEQKETLIGFISRLAEFMPWTERKDDENT